MKAESRVEISHKTVEIFNELHTIMLNMEKGIYGFLISGDDSYLEPFSQAEGLFDAKAKEALILFTNLLQQKEFVETIVQAKTAWISGPVMEDMLARKKFTRKMITIEDFIQSFKGTNAKQITDVIDSIVVKAKQIEEKTMDELAQIQRSAAFLVRLSVLLGMSGSIFFGLLMILLTLTRLNASITRRIETLCETTDKISHSSHDLSDLSQNLSYANNQVHSAIEETSQMIEKINESTAVNTSAAAESIRVSESCTKSADDGQYAMSVLLEAIGSVAASNDNVGKEFKESNEKLFNISKIIEEVHTKTAIINDIVFQTRLLSFNASVEAVRAGEHGKGFAVVAEEIGNLATLSGGAAKEISLLLDGSTQQIKKIVEETTQNFDTLLKNVQVKITDSQSRAKESEQTLLGIKKYTHEMKAMVQTITNGSLDQAASINKITAAMMHIKEMLAKNHETSEKYSASSMAFEGLAETLNSEIMSLRGMFLTNARIHLEEAS